MKYKDLIIQVKTKWIKDVNDYYRDIIEYKINCSDKLDALSATRFICENSFKKERSNIIKDNKLEINMYDKQKNYIEPNNDKLKTLLEYTKYQWEAID